MSASTIVEGAEIAAAALPAISNFVSTIESDTASHQTALNTASDAVAAAESAAAPVASALPATTQAKVTAGFSLLGGILSFLKEVL